jgi:hypothetical protein
MPQNITVRRGRDGFGSQLLSIFSGIAWCRTHPDNTYWHSSLSDIKLSDMENTQNHELGKANEFVNQIIQNLGISTIDKCIGSFSTIESYHIPIKNKGVDSYYNEDFFSYLNASYTIGKSEYFTKPHNISIHIRRGADIAVKNPWRWIDESLYEPIIERFSIDYPDSDIHIFSWNDPSIKSRPNIKFHIVDNGRKFMDDFHAMVQSDILVVGSSSFSMSAGMLSKGVVLCDESIYKVSDPLPTSWINNFQQLMRIK